ncbi:ABC transporter permease [Sediminibacillus halophilus]|uniref:NitT/TauT family transport system permease protein n=1 Tax=Sediminibacillus halophilus TaxID=482461 RepID=A0A1G9QN47_9BACI|nr:ABC transporter permease [Sediminibacillus halophilus]SDM12452.1 NitT/TauT family transport system permease protein [Sediminibacillus halophilus]
MKTNTKSDDQLFEQYRKHRKSERKSVMFWQFIIFVVFFAFWELASRQEWIDPLIFSSPSQVGLLFTEKLLDGSLWFHLQVTLIETIIGFALGTIFGIILAAILWWSEKLSKILDPYLVVLNAMPKVALGPIIIVALGPGYFSIIAMGAIICVIITTLVVYSAFREVDENYVKVLKSFGANRRQCFTAAILPASFPAMISTLKVNVGLSWVGVIVGEFLVSAKGLGYLIVYGFQVFDFTLVLYSLLVIAILAAIMYQLVEKLEKWLIKNTEQ